MPQVTGGGVGISRGKAKRIVKRALKGPKTKPAPAARSKTVVTNYPKVAKKALSEPRTKNTRKAANKYLIKASGTTKKEVQGVRSNLKRGTMTKKQAVKALNESGSKKRVRKALSKPKPSARMLKAKRG